MFWQKKLAQWANQVRKQANLPARLMLWNGQQYDFGQFTTPQVILHVKSVLALPYLFKPSLDQLGEAYVHNKIDVEGKLTDVIHCGYTLAQNALTSRSKFDDLRHYFKLHTRAADKKSIQYHYDVSNAFYQLWLDKN